jgi:DNA-binding NarL/FixJ family response regulator
LGEKPLLAKIRLRLYLFHVSKQRPSKIAPRKPAGPFQNPLNGFKAAYWRRRLFKNSFTRDGQRKALKGWSVKIQYQGRRRTFTLTAANREAAAREAWRIYRKIVSVDRQAVTNRRAGTSAGSASLPPTNPLEPSVAKDAGYWKLRLLHRDYLKSSDAHGTAEFSVRVEHAGTSHYFRLGTSSEAQAAAVAAKIHRTVISQGWEAANERFRRELTVAIRWADDPVAWTYTTIHTQRPAFRAQPLAASDTRSPQLNVALIESDSGIRDALADCIHRQDGFFCIAAFASLTQALQGIDHKPIHLALANHCLADTQGTVWLEKLKAITPYGAGLFYSVYEDSDRLFASVPGGVAGYLLKRTPPSKILEPVVDTLETGNFSSRALAISVQQYFRRVLLPSPSSGRTHDLSQLTHREHEVLALLSKGYLDKEIADFLRISIWTVHGHVKNIFEKLNVHSRTGAVVKFLQK